MIIELSLFRFVEEEKKKKEVKIGTLTEEKERSIVYNYLQSRMSSHHHLMTVFNNPE